MTTSAVKPSAELELRPRSRGWFGARSGARFCLGLLGLLTFFCVLRWNTFDTPLIRDEGENAYAAQLLRQHLLPYEHSFFQKPPLVFFTYSLAETLAPRTFWAPRILASLFAAAATVLVGFVAYREFGAPCAWPAMWLLTPMLLLPRLDQSLANTEMFMILPLMGTMALFVAGRDGWGGSRTWFAAGFTAALTLLFKYTALPPLALVFVFWSIQGSSRQGLWRKWLSAGLGALLGTVLVLGIFLLHDGGKHWWECTVRFNRFYTQSESFGVSGALDWLRRFATDWWLLCLLPFGLLLKWSTQAALWVAFFAAAVLSTSMSHYGQYYIVLMPFWALLVVLANEHIAERFSAKQPGRVEEGGAQESEGIATRVRWPLSAGAIRIALTVAAVTVVCVPDLPAVLSSRSQVALDLPETLNGALVAGERVAALSAPNEPIYVAGSEPQILCYAHRLSSTRFVTAYPLMIPTPLALGYQREAIRELQANPPKLIVWAAENSSWLRHADSPTELLSFLTWSLAHNYQTVGGYVVKDGHAHWQEPLSNEQLGDAIMTLYRRSTPLPSARKQVE